MAKDPALLPSRPSEGRMTGPRPPTPAPTRAAQTPPGRGGAPEPNSGANPRFFSRPPTGLLALGASAARRFHPDTDLVLTIINCVKSVAGCLINISLLLLKRPRDWL